MVAQFKHLLVFYGIGLPGDGVMICLYRHILSCCCFPVSLISDTFCVCYYQIYETFLCYSVVAFIYASTSWPTLFYHLILYEAMRYLVSKLLDMCIKLEHLHVEL